MSKSILAQYGVTFYFAGKLMSQSQLKKAASLYEICRETDDIADTAKNKSEALKKLSIEKKNLLDEDFSSPWSKKVHNVLSAEGKYALLDLLDGVMSDLDNVRMNNERELYLYCYQVAGSVGLMMCDIFEIKDKRAFDYAVTLGIAMQITNICRDVLEDANIDRRYLPGDQIDNLEPKKIINPNPDNRNLIKKNVKHLLIMADSFYDYSSKGLVFLPWRVRLGILVASHAYREIGHILKYRHGCNIWKGRVFTSSRRKTYVAFKAIIRSIFSPSFYFYQPNENLPPCLQELKFKWHQK